MQTNIILLISSLLLVSVVSSMPVSANSQISEVSGPYVTNTGQSSAFVNWISGEESSFKLFYDDELNYTKMAGYSKILEKPDYNPAACLYRAELSGLVPDTVYHYKITGEGFESGDCTFRTFPKSGGFSFVVIGDTHASGGTGDGNYIRSLLASEISGQEPLFVIFTGDMVSEGLDVSGWDEFFNEMSPVLRNSSVFTSPGNHEDNSTLYYDYFGYPEWYSFECGDSSFYSLDSNENACPLMDLQNDWIEESLPGNNNLKFVYFHHPPYSSDKRHPGGWKNIRDQWSGYFSRYSVDAVFSGHVHAYEHYFSDLTHYLITGTGGGNLYALSDEKPEGYLKSSPGVYGYLRIDVLDNGKTALCEFVPVILSEKTSEINQKPVNEYGDRFEINSCFENSLSRKMSDILGIFPGDIPQSPEKIRSY
ncbi:metallophosphoesterase family protein [Methanochimaera problematica]|uniref:metallophosphoesterase family protein n=1 Tax=Methanochimaera problematica TaxID=2609417 RepID=UPI002938FE84|nr:metallophosphoesterase family protein [Methanoplanus sp. FWC-SCC4]